jgi:hypothetical protein
MASLIHEIENNEAILLMFINGELPAEDRAEVEQMLAGDTGLREELVRIRSAYNFAMDSLAALDGDRSAIPGENHAIRQAKRAMKQWQSDRLHRQPASVTAPVRKVPGWAYGSAVAAMLLIGTLTYWGIVGDSTNSSTDHLANADQTNGSINGAGGAGGDTRPPSDPVLAEYLMDRTSDHSADLARAELQAKDLIARSDSSAVASSVVLGDDDAQ